MTRILTTTAVILIASSLRVHAQGWIETHPAREGSGAVIRTESSVSVTIDGPVARFEVTERYRNQGRRVAEGSYLFPIPGEAVFTDFSLFQGEEELRGEMLPADEAQSIYEEIVRRKRDPALLTLAGHGVIRARVFPIAPGETRTVTLRFTQLLSREGDALRLRYALGSRGGLGTPVDFTLYLPDATEYGVPFSPTHTLDVRRAGPVREVHLGGDRPSGDVEILLPTGGGTVSLSLLTHRPSSREEGYFMLLLSPPDAPNQTTQPRDLTAVVDVSGSMAGQKLHQAKAALRQAIGTVRRGDRFRLIAFSTAVREMRDGWSPATETYLHQAEAFIAGLEAGGGTNIGSALETALSGEPSPGRHRVVLFLTDGLPSVGERDPEAIAALATARLRNARVFPFGVGHDVNTYLLDRLARDGRGTVEYVAPGEDVERAVGRVVRRISRPALTDLRLTTSAVELTDFAPGTLPDLFAGDEVVLTGRYRGSGRGRLILEGARNGVRERIALEVSFPRTGSDNGFIPSIWASRRIGELTREILLEGERKELISQIRELGLRYGILTPYTSYLVQEPTLVATRIESDGIAPRTQAPLPQSQSGAEAFRSARESQAQRLAKTVDQVEEGFGDRVGRGNEGRGNLTGEVRRISGRILQRRGEVWTDIAVQDTLEEMHVAPYSEAYFALIRALPQLAGALQAGDEVLLAGRRMNLRVTPEGRRSWGAGELARFLTRFQGP